MESAIFISDIPALKYFSMSRFDRIYYGNEFCEHLLPAARQVEAVLEFAGANRVPVTLVTPILYEAGLEKAEALLEMLPRGAEVVFNDFGLLDAIKSLGLVPVHGKMLFASTKDPRIGCGSPSQEFFRAHNLQPPYLDMLQKLGVGRVEIDNALQGYDLSPFPGMPVSIYYPFVSCTVTRKCVFANAHAASAGLRGGAGFVVECNRQCQGRILQADIGGGAVSIMGNAQFYRNETPPGNLDAMGVDRTVYMPVFPNSNSGARDLGFLDWSFPYITSAHEKSWGTQPDKTTENLVASLALRAGSRVLDIGCGAGRNAPILIKGGLQYTGIDIAGAAIALARRAFPGNNFIQGDALDRDWDENLFDIAIDYGFFHTLPPWKRKRYFALIEKIVTPGGHLITAAWDGTPSPAPIEYVCGHLPEWACNEEEFTKLAGPAFRLIHTEIRPEGKWLLRYYVMKNEHAE